MEKQRMPTSKRSSSTSLLAALSSSIHSWRPSPRVSSFESMIAPALSDSQNAEPSSAASHSSGSSPSVAEASKRPERWTSWRSWKRMRDQVRRRTGLRKLCWAHAQAAASPLSLYTCSNSTTARSSAIESDQAQKSCFIFFAASLLSGGLMKTVSPRPAISNADVIWGMPKRVPSIMARPINGSSGMRESTWPTGSITGGDPSLMASMDVSSAIAASRLATIGGSGAFARKSRGSRPREIVCRQVCAKLQRWISGAGRQGTDSNWSRL
mmetsp:Transcript_84215/g.247026  ORF Transcript_84215/g.247026 Transcript_84215/m.247026 type:complete len:268 (+) Transcript_84215:771-1574(+)